MQFTSEGKLYLRSKMVHLRIFNYRLSNYLLKPTIKFCGWTWKLSVISTQFFVSIWIYANWNSFCSDWGFSDWNQKIYSWKIHCMYEWLLRSFLILNNTSRDVIGNCSQTFLLLSRKEYSTLKLKFLYYNNKTAYVNWICEE